MHPRISNMLIGLKRQTLLRNQQTTGHHMCLDDGGDALMMMIMMMLMMMTDDNVRCDNEDCDWDDEDERKVSKQRMKFEEGEILLRLSNLDKYMSRFLQNMYNKAKVII